MARVHCKQKSFRTAAPHSLFKLGPHYLLKNTMKSFAAIAKLVAGGSAALAASPMANQTSIVMLSISCC